MVVASFVGWDVARAGGVVAYVLVTLGILAGLLLSGRARVALWPRFAVEDVHRYLGLLGGVFVALHVLSIVVDDYTPISLADALVPFRSSYQPLGTGLGVVALDLLVAFAVTNRLKRKLPYRWWRRAHYASFAIWILATAHAIVQGSDTGTAPLSLLYAISVGGVCAATAWRALRVAPARRRASDGAKA